VLEVLGNDPEGNNFLQILSDERLPLLIMVVVRLLECLCRRQGRLLSLERHFEIQ
jgi:hypothetical protein